MAGSARRVFTIAAPRGGNACAECRGHQGSDCKGRILAGRRRTCKTTDARIARTITARQIARHLPLRGNVDLEALRDDGIDARFHVRRIDVLVTPVFVLAHERAVGTALRFAASFELRITSKIAIHVLERRTPTLTTSRTRFLAGRRCALRTRRTTAARAAGLRIRHAIALGVIRLAFRDKRLLALGHTAANAIERHRIAIVQAFGVARIRAIRNWLRHTIAIAARLEIQRRTVDRAFSSDFDFAVDVVEVEVVVATLGRRRNGECLRRTEEHCGNSENRKHEFAQGIHGSSFRAVD